MDMSSSQRNLIGRLELENQLSPRSYRQKVFLLALLGHAYVYGLLLLALFGIFCGLYLHFGLDSPGLGGVVILLSIAAAIVIWRTLQMIIPPPEGSLLDTDEAPKLRHLLGKIRAQSHGPAVQSITIDDSFAVYIQATPRWGVIGPVRHELAIGLPLLQSLTPKQALSMIAHEYAHYSNTVDPLGARVHRIRRHWQNYEQSLPSDPSPLEKILIRFFRWYIPYFGAYSFILAREHEFAADRLAASFIGHDRTAHALIRSAVLKRFLDDTFWPSILSRAQTSPRPDVSPHKVMAAALRAEDGNPEIRQLLRQELARKANYEDTHPCLDDRLSALREKPKLVGLAGDNAAEYLLGERYAGVIADLDQNWFNSVRQSWEEQFRIVDEARKLLARNAGRTPDEMDIDTLGAYAQALLALGERNKAMPLLRRAAEHPKGNATTAWAMAQELLANDDPQAIHFLELVMIRDVRLIREATVCAVDLCERHGNRERAAYYRQQLAEIGVQ